jgi:hypothetical protein
MSSLETNVIRPDFGAAARHGAAASANRLDVLLDTIASLDLEYEEKRSMIAASTCGLDFKERILRKFKERHRARRQPYLAQLVQLQGAGL